MNELRGSNSEFDPLGSVKAVVTTLKKPKKTSSIPPTEAVQGDREPDPRGSNSEFDPLSSFDVMLSVKGAKSLSYHFQTSLGFERIRVHRLLSELHTQWVLYPQGMFE